MKLLDGRLSWAEGVDDDMYIDMQHDIRVDEMIAWRS